jgi:hypothetical protein
LRDLLRNGIDVEIESSKTIKMVYIGNSKSGKREKTFWTVDKNSFDKINFSQFLCQFGDFSNLKTVEKFSKRFALNFSTSRPTIELDVNEYLVVEDEVTKDGKFEFTEGIGIMRANVAKDVSTCLGITYNPSIFHFRFGGFKGVLVGMPDLIFDNILYKNGHTKNPKIKVIFRKSQQKFTNLRIEQKLNILSWPGEFLPNSRLNSEFIMVLDALDKSGHLQRKILECYNR